MYDYSRPREYTIDLEDGFIAKTTNKEVIEKHDLLGKGSLHFVNTLSELVDEKKDSLPEEEWTVLERTLNRLMIDYENGELYYYLVHSFGSDAISYNAWAHFSLDTVWSVCVRTFTDMPTEVIEEYGVRHWARRNTTVGKEGSAHLMQAINERTDIYGQNGGLPPKMVAGILFSGEALDDVA